MGGCFRSRGSARGRLSVVGPSSAGSAEGETSPPRKPAGKSSFCCWGSERGGSLLSLSSLLWRPEERGSPPPDPIPREARHS